MIKRKNYRDKCIFKISTQDMTNIRCKLFMQKMVKNQLIEIRLVIDKDF